MVSTSLAPDVAAYIRDLEDAADGMEATLLASAAGLVSPDEIARAVRHYAQVRSEMAGLLVA